MVFGQRARHNHQANLMHKINHHKCSHGAKNCAKSFVGIFSFNPHDSWRKSSRLSGEEIMT